VRVAGICAFGGDVQTLEVDDRRPLVADEVLIDVRAAGVCHWDELVRTGGWNVGVSPPMALGVEAAGVISAVGAYVGGFGVGDEVLCHPVPLRDQGGSAPLLIAAVGSVASKPSDVSWDIGGVFPIPALTAEQVVSEALRLQSGEALLVHGAGGSTGGMMAQLAARRGADVIATCSPRSAGRVRSYGARTVIDYHESGWPQTVRALFNGQGRACGGQRGYRRRRNGDDHPRRRRAAGDHHVRPAASRPRNHRHQRLSSFRRPSTEPARRFTGTTSTNHAHSAPLQNR